ncbi:MAG: DUF4145 domain-containing protein [Candidatus Lokiarchaeota archaeon]|nr:DUF4145 domain-containing protein [Candidatus Lokiarchaeota archaeon]
MCDDYNRFEFDNFLYGEVETYTKEREKKWSNSDIESRLFFDRSESFAFHILECCKKLYSLETIDEDLSTLRYELKKLYAHEKGDLENELSDKIKEIVYSGKDRNIIAQEVIDCYNKYNDNLPFYPHEKESPLRLVWERLSIEYAGTLTSSVSDLANRTIELYQLILHVTPSKEVIPYLSNLAKCYIWGFDSECIILCRSVIDNAFSKKTNNQICEKHLGERHWKNFTLEERILVAQKEGILDENMKTIADTIRTNGNDVVHLDPNIVKDSFGSIKNTIAVLECLYT